jgi:hypothetical protein
MTGIGFIVLMFGGFMFLAAHEGKDANGQYSPACTFFVLIAVAGGGTLFVGIGKWLYLVMP